MSPGTVPGTPVGPPGGFDIPPPAGDPCAASACVKAKADFETVKERVVAACERLRWPVSVAIAIRAWIESINWWIVIILVIVAIIFALFGFLLPMWIVVALLVVLFVVYMVFLIFQRIAQRLAGDLQKEVDALREAAKAVHASCPVHCWGDILIPTCDVPSVEAPRIPDILSRIPWPWK